MIEPRKNCRTVISVRVAHIARHFLEAFFFRKNRLNPSNDRFIRGVVVSRPFTLENNRADAVPSVNMYPLDPYRWTNNPGSRASASSTGVSGINTPTRKPTAFRTMGANAVRKRFLGRNSSSLKNSKTNSTFCSRAKIAHPRERPGIRPSLSDREPSLTSQLKHVNDTKKKSTACV